MEQYNKKDFANATTALLSHSSQFFFSLFHSCLQLNIRDFKQRQLGRRRERHKIREKPKGPLRMTGGKQVDVLRSGPT